MHVDKGAHLHVSTLRLSTARPRQGRKAEKIIPKFDAVRKAVFKYF